VLTTCGRALGQVFRGVDGLARFAKRKRAGAADLAACLMGLGVLIANGSAIQMKGCGGVKIHSATALAAPVAALALALACEREVSRKSPHALALEGIDKQLDPSPRLFFARAREFMHDNRDVVRRLDRAGGLDQELSLRAAGSWSARACALGLRNAELILWNARAGAATVGDSPRLASAREGSAGSDEKEKPSSPRSALVDESFSEQALGQNATDQTCCATARDDHQLDHAPCRTTCWRRRPHVRRRAGSARWSPESGIGSSEPGCSRRRWRDRFSIAEMEDGHGDRGGARGAPRRHRQARSPRPQPQRPGADRDAAVPARP
jgi:hypothetical protein